MRLIFCQSLLEKGKKKVIKILSHGIDMCVNKFVIVVKRKNLFPKSSWLIVVHKFRVSINDTGCKGCSFNTIIMTFLELER